MEGDLAANKLEHLGDHGVEVIGLTVRLLALDHLAHTDDHLSGAFVVGNDFLERLSHLAKIGRVAVEEAQRRPGVGKNRGEGLVGLVGDCRRQLTDELHPIQVRQLVPQRPRLLFHPQPLGDLLAKPLVGGPQLGGSLLDPLLELIARLLELDILLGELSLQIDELVIQPTQVVVQLFIPAHSPAHSLATGRLWQWPLERPEHSRRRQPFATDRGQR